MEKTFKEWHAAKDFVCPKYEVFYVNQQALMVVECLNEREKILAHIEYLDFARHGVTPNNCLIIWPSNGVVRNGYYFHGKPEVIKQLKLIYKGSVWQNGSEWSSENVQEAPETVVTQLKEYLKLT